MQNHQTRRPAAKTARIDRRPAIAITAVSILTSLFAAYQLFS